MSTKESNPKDSVGINKSPIRLAAGAVQLKPKTEVEATSILLP